jgi:competence protein ComEA
MPPSEARALLLLLALAVAGQGVRYLLTRPGQAPGEVQLLSTLSPGSPTAQRDSAVRLARPLRANEKIDVDQAPVSELTRLPRVGPRLAKTIAASRNEHGPFGSLSGLDRVPGVGPGLLQTLEPHVVFSGAAVPPAGLPVPSSGPAGPLNINTATVQQLDSLPGIGPSRAAAILRYRQEHGPFAAVDQLSQVPGMGPAALVGLQDRIVAR